MAAELSNANKPSASIDYSIWLHKAKPGGPMLPMLPIRTMQMGTFALDYLRVGILQARYPRPSVFIPRGTCKGETVR